MHNFYKILILIFVFSLGSAPVGAQAPIDSIENKAAPRLVVFEGFYNPA